MVYDSPRINFFGWKMKRIINEIEAATADLRALNDSMDEETRYRAISDVLKAFAKEPEFKKWMPVAAVRVMAVANKLPGER
jgi:hypothetical protein